MTEQGHKVLNIATTNTERLIRLINDILDLERMKSGKITMQMTRCNAFTLLTQATEAMQALADQSHITLITNPAEVELWADPDRLLQTLTNLLSNAIKFSEAGSTIWLNAELFQDAGSRGQESGVRGQGSELLQNSKFKIQNLELPIPFSSPLKTRVAVFPLINSKPSSNDFSRLMRPIPARKEGQVWDSPSAATLWSSTMAKFG